MDASFDLKLEEEKTSRFGSSTKTDKKKLLDDKDKKKTLSELQKNAVKILMDYLAEKKLKNLHDLEDDELPEILLDLYTNLRKVKGGMYKLQTLKCICAGLNRDTKSGKEFRYHK